MSRPSSWLYCLLYSRFMRARIVTELTSISIWRKMHARYTEEGGPRFANAREALNADQFPDASVSIAEWCASIPNAWLRLVSHRFVHGLPATRAKYVSARRPPASDPESFRRDVSFPTSRIRVRRRVPLTPNLVSESPIAR